MGVDIGTSSIKIAEILKKGDSFRLANYGILETKSYLEHPNQAIQTSSLRIVEKDAAELLKTMLREIKPKTRTAIASIPAFVSFVTPIEMPLMKPDETSKAVAFEARQLIPLPPSEVTLDWLKIEEFQGSRGQSMQRILLMGVPNEIVRKYKTIFKTADVKIAAFEIESLALVRALAGADNVLTLSVDIGAEATNILVSENGVLKYNGVTDYGGIYITQAVGRSLGVSSMRAEELKRRRGLTGTGGEMELSTLIVPFLDVIIQECRHVVDVCERRYGKRAEKLILTGGGANLLGIEKYFVSQLNLPLGQAPQLSNLVYEPDLEPARKGLDNALLVAIGLAKRYFK